MNKENIELIFKSLLSADDCSDTTDKGVYRLHPLMKTVSSNSVEYGFSLSIFGVLALRTQYKGKWADYIEITGACYKSLNVLAIPNSTGDFFRVKVENTLFLNQLCQDIYSYCKNNLHGEYDCCHLYEKCSDQLKCVSTLKQRSLLCRYRKKLDSGIVYFGKNRNIN